MFSGGGVISRGSKAIQKCRSREQEAAKKLG